MTESTASIALSADEAAIVAGLVRDQLGSLRGEIYKTENYDLRQELHKRESLLKGLLARLESTA
ncbi:MAG TPA: hypothetical protein VKV26_04815 [Dehalococcoidia bacterium]|nr:hypothetical protein [Dehalococcoidia bacterium]